MANPTNHDDPTVQNALQMFCDGIKVSKICDVIGISRQTFYNWKNKGILTDGTPWDDWCDKQQTLEKASVENENLTVEVERSDEFWQEQLPKLRKAVQDGIDQLAKSGDMLGPDEITKLMKLVNRIENRGAELQMLQEEFMRQALFAVREEVDEHTFQVITEKVKKIQMEQLKDYDEADAAALLNN